MLDRQITRRTALAGLGLGAVSAVVACQSAAQGSSPSSSSSKPKRGGVLQAAQLTDIDPQALFGVGVGDSVIGRLIFNTLTEYNDKTVPQPSLATSWSTSADGTTVTLDLRQGVTFHSGRAFGPEDVTFSIQQMQDPARSQQLLSTAQVITDVSASGSHQVKLRLAHPMSNLFDLFQVMLIVDRETLTDLLSGSNLVGTGPFKFGKWTPNSSVTMTRNKSYWKVGRPYLDGVNLRIIPDPQTLLAAMQAHQVEFTLALTQSNLNAVAGSSTVKTAPLGGTTILYVLGCNVKVSPLDRKEVRQAISWAVNRKQILSQVLENVGYTTSIPFPKVSPAFDQKASDYYSYNPSKAKQMLAAAGVSNVKLPLLYNAGVPALAQVAQIVGYNLQQVGIGTQIAPVQGPVFQHDMGVGSLQGLFLNIIGESPSPATALLLPLPYKPNGNASNFVSPQYQSLVNKAWTTTSGLPSVYRQIRDLLLDEQFVINLVLGENIVAALPNFKGYKFVGGAELNLEDAYLT